MVSPNTTSAVATFDIIVYPNPVSNILTVKIEPNIAEQVTSGQSSAYEIRMFNALGTLVHQTTISGTTAQINMNNLPNDNYMLQVYDGAGNPSVFRHIIVSH